MGSINNEMLILLDTELTTLNIMNICPHLISLTYHSLYEFPDISVKDIPSDNTNPKRLDSSLKELKLSAPTIPYHYATYLKDYLVPHVNVLKININDIDVFDWIEGFRLDNAVEFLRSLSQVKPASICWEPYKHNDRDYQHGI
ncbi:hypothetical protein INT47_004468 [Mucor saturninus]|uniref:Uncharacterized protein n=1 Tax=Mucor saturninus TaxID=64648 RepID=A0A8H7QVS2_9FUNG|nr:hypothetical protein INT47_004468 [Mucor saturninus]